MNFNESYLFPGLPALTVAAFFALLSPVSSIEEKDIDSASVLKCDLDSLLLFNAGVESSVSVFDNVSV